MYDEKCHIVDNTLVKYKGNISEFIADDRIKAVGDSAFAANMFLRIVSLPYDIDYIGDKAFAICSKLSIVQSKGVIRKICDSAFFRCSDLIYMEMNDGLESIGDYAFLSSGIVRADIPDSVKSIGMNAFGHCVKLSKVSLSDNLTEISVLAFNACNKLKEITIPDKVTYIGESAFSSCKALEKIDFGSSVSVIDDCAFSGCSSLEYVTLPPALKEVKLFAFFCCQKLKTVSFPNSCRHIDKKAFFGCKSLRNLICSENVTSFRGSVLETIWDSLYDTDIKIQLISSMLRNYISLISDEKSVVKKIKANKKKIAEFAIKENDTQVIANLFSLYKKIPLEELDRYISCSSESPEVMAFLLSYKSEHYTAAEQDDFETDKLEKELGFRERTPAEWNKLYKYEIYQAADDSEEYICINGYKGEEELVIVPDKICGITVKQIGDLAFCPQAKGIRKEIRESRRKITSVILPPTIDYIGDEAFALCESLQNIVIPEGVIFLGRKTFMCCKSLKSVTLPSSLTHICEKAFYYCEALERISLPDKLKRIETEAFANCKSLVSFTIPDRTERLEKQALRNCESLTYVNLGKGLRYIGESAFNLCTGLTTLIIPESVEIIRGGAFGMCKNLSEIKIPDTVQHIGSNILHDTAFFHNRENWYEDALYAGNHVLDTRSDRYNSVSLRPGTVSIADTAMSGCSFLRDIMIPGTVRVIGDSAFLNCKNLRSVVIEEGVKEIHKEAFYNCDRLKNILLPESIEYLGKSVFTDTRYGRTYENWQNGALYVGNYLIRVRDTVSGPFAIREGTKVVAEYAFFKCRNITSVTIPSSVTDIGEMCFFECTSLKFVRILYGLKKIPDNAFCCCFSLNQVIIPDSITEIGKGAFFGSEPVIHSSAESCGKKYAETNNLRHSMLTFDIQKK